MATIGDISKHVLGNTILAQLTTRYPTPTASVSRRTYVVTGANTGLGFPLVAHLVALDAARNIFAVRGPAKGAAARDTILQGPPQYRGVLEVWELDMALFASVAQFAHRAEAELNRLDGAALNAGVATNGWHTTADGWETKSQVNALSTGLLAVLMLPLLYKTAHLPLLPDTDHIVPHLTITGSGAQNVAKFIEQSETHKYPGRAERRNKFQLLRPISHVETVQQLHCEEDRCVATSARCDRQCRRPRNEPL